MWLRHASGKVRGFAEDGQIAFLGIPMPCPVGELRLKQAVPVKPWEGVRGCDGIRPQKAVQYNDGVCEGSEDCPDLKYQKTHGGREPSGIGLYPRRRLQLRL